VCSANKSMFVELIEEQKPTETAAAPEATSQSPPAVQPAAPLTLPARIYALASGLTALHHLHPIMVHTPNGVVPMALVFLLIGAWFGSSLWATAAWYSLIFVLISLPLVLFTGYVMWQQRYRRAFTPIFKIKISASIVTVVLLLGLIIWWAIQPEIITAPLPGRWIYLTGCFLLVVAVGIAGHFGGKLVFGNRRD